MKNLLLVCTLAIGLPITAAQAQDANAKASPCTVVQKGTASAGASASAGGLSSTVTAGGGQVSASTTTSGGSVITSSDIGRTRVTVQPGSSVTVHSGSSDGSSSAAAAVTSSNGQVTVLSSGNGCVVTIEPRG